MPIGIKGIFFQLLLFFCASSCVFADAIHSIPLKLTTANIHDAELYQLADGTAEIRTTGSDPYIFTEPIAQKLDPKLQHMLSFEYFSTAGTGAIQVFLNPPVREEFSEFGSELIHSEGFSSYSINLKSVFDRFSSTIQGFRIDFGNEAGKIIRIRSLEIRSETKQELELAVRKERYLQNQKLEDSRLHKYLTADFPCALTNIHVDDNQITIQGSIGKTRGSLFLAEAPLYENLLDMKKYPFLTPIVSHPQTQFQATVERYRKSGKQTIDRLLSRWVVVSKIGDGYKLLSHARYPDSIQPANQLPLEKPRNKKGLGGFSIGRPVEDLDELNISAATVNIVLNSLFSTEPAAGRTAFLYGGRTWYSHDTAVAQLDSTLQESAKHSLVISAIVLIAQAKSAPEGSFSRLLAHPDADPSGIYAMPNVSSEQGTAAYAAALDFLAKRYSRPDNRYGRIHHWIMHNEVNAGWVWTNAGEKTALLYMDLYHKSMRMAELIARQYNSHSKAFISLEHHWTMILPKFYAGRELLELLSLYSKAEGDFDWGIAFHPYPQDLFNPKVWQDNEITFTFNTPKITFKNLEVLDSWVKQPRFLFQGQTVRSLQLTEQGLNSLDYSEKSLNEQAAGMAYAWNKYKNLDSIEVFDYHNWVDNRGEGGLRIGLRRFPDDKEEPLGRKPIWYVYKAMGTENENSIIDSYKKIVGINDWSEVVYRGKIE